MPHDAPPALPSARPPEGAAAVSAPVEDLGIVDGLAQLSFLVQAVLGKVAAEHGLSIIQLRLLGILRDRTPGMQELAGYLGLDKSSMTGLVDRAERRDLVQRNPAPHDKRAVQVALTAQGHQLARALGVEVGKRIQTLTDALTDTQRAQLSLLVSTLIAADRTAA